MSFNSGEFGRVFAEAWSAAQKQGAVGGSGSGGRRGGRGPGSGDRGGIRKNAKARCHHCRSTEHLIAYCPHKDESRRKARQRLREAHSAQEVLPAAAEESDLPPTPAAPVASGLPAPALAPAPAPVPATPATPAARPPLPLVWEPTVGRYSMPRTDMSQSDTSSAPAIALTPAPTGQPTVSFLVWPRATPEQQTFIQYAVPRDEPQCPPPPADEPRTGRPPARLGWSVHWSEVHSRWYYRKFLEGRVSWEEPR